MNTRIDTVRDTEAGFSLIELLVVVIIIGILAAIAVPIYINVQNSAKDSAVKSDLSNIKTAVVASFTSTGLTTTAPITTAADIAALKDFGYTASQNYAAADAPAYASGSTAIKFCIWAKSTTGAVISITSSAGAAKATCGATTTW